MVTIGYMFIPGSKGIAPAYFVNIRPGMKVKDFREYLSHVPANFVFLKHQPGTAEGPEGLFFASDLRRPK